MLHFFAIVIISIFYLKDNKLIFSIIINNYATIILKYQVNLLIIV